VPQPLHEDNLSRSHENLGPRLVPRTDPTDEPTRSALTLWHLFSLDAPTVAALWTYFLARCTGISLPWTAPAAMFIAVWMIYAADRLLDARALDAQPAAIPDLEERHRFHHRHRSRFLPALSFAACALIYLLPHIAPRALLLYTLLATLLGTWLLFVHARGHHGSAPRRLPKELAVGIFFSAAVFIPTVARAPWLQVTLLAPAVLFAGVCALNCLFLYAWEHPKPRSSQPQAHWTTLWSVRHLPQLAVSLVILSLSVPALTASPKPPMLACALSTTLLLLLHLGRRRLSAVPLRAAADAVLLTPLLFMVLPRIISR
jgi:hypothetical protein